MQPKNLVKRASEEVQMSQHSVVWGWSLGLFFFPLPSAPCLWSFSCSLAPLRKGCVCRVRQAEGKDHQSTLYLTSCSQTSWVKTDDHDEDWGLSSTFKDHCYSTLIKARQQGHKLTLTYSCTQWKWLCSTLPQSPKLSSESDSSVQRCHLKKKKGISHTLNEAKV